MVARFDLATDPAVLADLLETRRATAFFARKLNELDDADLDGATLLAGWTRRHLVAHLGYNARGLCRLVTWANTGVETPMYASAEQREREIARGATLQPHALRHLFDHSAVSLNVEWRDTDDAGWQARIRTAQGRELPLAETPWLRTRELWIHAIDLGNGARWTDIPEGVSRRILRDVVAVWTARGAGAVRLRDTDGGVLAEVPGAHPLELRGELPVLVAWATGRGGGADLGGLVAVRGGAGGEVPLPEAPRWI